MNATSSAKMWGAAMAGGLNTLCQNLHAFWPPHRTPIDVLQSFAVYSQRTEELQAPLEKAETRAKAARKRPMRSAHHMLVRMMHSLADAGAAGLVSALAGTVGR
ncbi:hypothetical protein BGZ67_006954 [Mortierella alpina]|nr:hypothetical protein BGZ67_006954 [Mortierella alpina]